MADGAHREVTGSGDGGDGGDRCARFVTDRAHREVTSSRYDTSDPPVRTHATITTSVFSIIEREFTIPNVVAFGEVDGDLI